MGTSARLGRQLAAAVAIAGLAFMHQTAQAQDTVKVGKAVSIASVFEIDNVIDPAETRRWIMAGLRSVPKPPARTAKKRPCIDTW